MLRMEYLTYNRYLLLVCKMVTIPWNSAKSVSFGGISFNGNTEFYMYFLLNSGHSSGYDSRSVRAFSYGGGE